MKPPFNIPCLNAGIHTAGRHLSGAGKLGRVFRTPTPSPGPTPACGLLSAMDCPSALSQMAISLLPISAFEVCAAAFEPFL